MSSLIEPGEVWRLRHPDRDTQLTFLVTCVTFSEPQRDHAIVLLLDVDCPSFRCEVGQTTTWTFDSDDPEWSMLRRVS